MNIVEPILFQSRQHPPSPAIGAPGTSLNLISYARLEGFIHNIGRRALSLGIARGHVVAILIKDSILHASVVFGLTRLGVITLSVNDLNFPKTLKLDAIVTDGPTAAVATTRIVQADFSWTMGNGQPVEDRFVYRGNGDDVCRIVLTSGTTGELKAIAFTHNLIQAQIARHNHTLGNTFMECSRFFSDLALPSYICFRLLTYTLSRGGSFFFPGASAMDSLQTFGLYKIQGLIASPGALSGFLKFYEEHLEFESPFEIVYCTGSALPKSLSERVRARICRNIVYLYGTTETPTVAVMPAHRSDIPGAVGYVTPGVTVEIVDEAGRPLPAGSAGRVRIRSPFAVNEYLNNPEQTTKAFRDGFFYPGDTGYLTKENLLVLSGRESDVLNLGGEKVNPELIEDAIAKFAAVDQAAAFTVPNKVGIEEVWALVVPNAKLDEAALRAHCERSLPATFVPVRFVSVPSLPRNDNGKIERHRLKVALPGHD